MRTFLKFIKSIFTSFFFIVGLLFIGWIIFFDSNSYINQQKQKAEYQELQEQKQFYEDEIVKLEEAQQHIEQDPEQLEKYAREKYKYKKKGEEIYIIEKKSE